MSAASPHRPPAFPHLWLLWFGAAQVLLALLWWRVGWLAMVPVWWLSHGLVLWGTFRPGSRVLGPVLTRLPTQERVVWLTIDDGPSADTAAILELLDAHGAKATFFLVGERAAAHRALVREIARRGHGIGNHSMSHPAAWFWALGPSRMRHEVERCQRTLADITGRPPRWFRAVVGMANPFVSAALKRQGLTRVAWSARGYDGVAADAEQVVARIERDLAPGAIVLMHEGAPHGQNVIMLERLLQQLAVHGYRTVLPQ